MSRADELASIPVNCCLTARLLVSTHCCDAPLVVVSTVLRRTLNRRWIQAWCKQTRQVCQSIDAMISHSARSAIASRAEAAAKLGATSSGTFKRRPLVRKLTDGGTATRNLSMMSNSQRHIVSLVLTGNSGGRVGVVSRLCLSLLLLLVGRLMIHAYVERTIAIYATVLHVIERDRLEAKLLEVSSALRSGLVAD